MNMKWPARNFRPCALTICICFAMAGCASVVPNFDIPTTPEGVPTVRSITKRITCELAQLLDRNDGITSTLLIADIEVALQLNLTVNDTGGLSPSLTYINSPLFSFGLGGTLSQAREQNFTQKLFYSLRALRMQMDLAKKQNIDLAACGPVDTNLAGELGLRRTVELAFTGQHVAWDSKLSNEGAFGGYVNFMVTKNVNGGPTWTLTNFVGPGNNLATFSEVNTDKLTFAFARGDKAGTRFGLSGRQRAEQLIDSMNINQLTTQLSGVRLLVR